MIFYVVENDLDDLSKCLTGAQVPSLGRTYVLGCFDHRITFYDQQCRAFNLAAALLLAEKLKPDTSSVLVVGAGIGGLTLALALHTVGYKVTVYDKRLQTVAIQRSGHVRFIHPTVYDWPNPSSSVSATDLPFLNWTAGDTSSVIRRVEEQWAQLSFGITHKPGWKLLNIVKRADSLIAQSSRGEEEFNAIFLAVGFGEESYGESSRLKKYWDDDSLHRIDDKHKTIVVSGVGDGGLVDCFRAKFKDFYHPELINEFSLHTDLAKTKARLSSIEEEVRAVGDIESQRKMLTRAYQHLVIPKSYLDFLSERIRTDTTVILICKSKNYFSPYTAILNRFLLACLLKLGSVQILYDTVVECEEGEKTRIKLASGQEIEADVFVKRHGPDPEITCLLSSEDIAVIKKRSVLRGSLVSRLWPSTLFSPRKSRIPFRPHPSGGRRWSRETSTLRILNILNGQATYTTQGESYFRSQVTEYERRSGRYAAVITKIGYDRDDHIEENRSLLRQALQEGHGGPFDLVVTIGSHVTVHSREILGTSYPHLFFNVSPQTEHLLVNADERDARSFPMCGVFYPDFFVDKVVFSAEIINSCSLKNWASSCHLNMDWITMCSAICSRVVATN